MMTELEILRNALENLKSIAERQALLWQGNRYGTKGAEWRAKYYSTNEKITWLEKVIRAWEGNAR